MLRLLVLDTYLMRDLSEKNMHDAIVGIFHSYGFGPFDMEAVIFLAMESFEVTPFTYLSVYQSFRNYIVSTFECRKGSLISAGELKLTRTLVYYRE